MVRVEKELKIAVISSRHELEMSHNQPYCLEQREAIAAESGTTTKNVYEMVLIVMMHTKPIDVRPLSKLLANREQKGAIVAVLTASEISSPVAKEFEAHANFIISDSFLKRNGGRRARNA
jgi:hypothetical protein